MDRTARKNLAQFIEAINRDANGECEKIKNEALRYKEEKIKATKKKLAEEAKSRTDGEIDRLQSSYNKDLARVESKLKSELIQKRNSIEEDVFRRVEEKLLQFTRTEEYEAFLIKSAEKICNAFSGKGITLYLKKDDMKFSPSLMKISDKILDVKEDESILLGGIRASDEKYEADDTLELRLENQREYFREISHLSII